MSHGKAFVLHQPQVDAGSGEPCSPSTSSHLVLHPGTERPLAHVEKFKDDVDSVPSAPTVSGRGDVPGERSNVIITRPICGPDHPLIEARIGHSAAGTLSAIFLPEAIQIPARRWPAHPAKTDRTWWC
jgi:hypothetical protein